MKPPSHQLMTFAELSYDGPSSISPDYMAIARLEPENVGNGTSVRVFVKLDSFQLEAIFTRSITGGLEYQLPHGSRGFVSSPIVSIDSAALAVLFEWMEFLVPKAQAAGLDKRTGEFHGYHSLERWEPHTNESILEKFMKGEFTWHKRSPAQASD